MNYEEEVKYRDKILSQIRSGKKVTPEDRLWLSTHRIFNRVLGIPYLNTDIIQLQPNVNYHIRVKVEALTYPGRILPVITVPGGKGKIVTNNALTDYKGNTVQGKSVKMLGVLLDLHHDEAKLMYQSNLGLLRISFECEYFDDKQHLTIRKDSSTGDPNFAMLSEVLAENKIRYQCKAPHTDSFESLVFSVEWEAIPKE